MLKATKSGAPPEYRVEFAGEIDQDAHLLELVGDLPSLEKSRVTFSCKGVRAINSIGIKDWIIYFDQLRNRGGKLAFEECTLPIVYQVNLISNFVRIDEIKSLYLPYLCDACNKEFEVLKTVPELKGYNEKAPAAPCPHCGKSGSFDDQPELYFNFLVRE